MFLYGCSSMQSWWPMDQEYDEDPSIFTVSLNSQIMLFIHYIAMLILRPIIKKHNILPLATRGSIKWKSSVF